MDSDDDMHDAMGSASDGEQEYESDLMPSDNEVHESDESDYGFDDNGVDDDPQPASNRSQSTYLVLSEKDIRKRQEEALTNVSTVLDISRTQAGILLRHFKCSSGSDAMHHCTFVRDSAGWCPLGLEIACKTLLRMKFQQSMWSNRITLAMKIYLYICL
ncbi:hypothetical protein L7F22_062879 [Adiantum nelumboides]|nr:hypothetical protein [Adiantum nelumboides]